MRVCEGLGVAGSEVIVMTGDAVECPLGASTTEFSDQWPDVAPSAPTLRGLKQDCCGYEAILGYVSNPRAVWTTD